MKILRNAFLVLKFDLLRETSYNGATCVCVDYYGRILMENTNVNEIVEQVQKKKFPVWGIVLIVVACVLVLLGAVYVGISVYYMTHFYQGTTINNIDVSGDTLEEAKTKIEDYICTYELSLYTREGTTEVISAEAVGMQVKWNDNISGWLEQQNGFEWLLKCYKPNAFTQETEVTFDEALLNAAIDGLFCMQEVNQIKPQNAAISEYSKENGYTLIPCVEGNTIDRDVLKSVMESSILALENEIELESIDCYLEPEIKDDYAPILTALEQLNTCLSTVVTYQVGGATQVLDESVFQPWILLGEDYQVSLDENAIHTYVAGLAHTYNTYGLPKTFKTSYGKDVVLTNSHYGWSVDGAAEVAAIKTEIMSGQTVTRDLHYATAANSRGVIEYGNSYVEINLTAQHMFLYVNGQVLMECDFVSGEVDVPENRTPTGAYRLSYKTKDVTLRGADYETPVSYWMPFYGNFGMHDAIWRSEYGGTIYKYDGSHGCINMPKGSARILYQHIYAGFPVFVYELAGTESEKGLAMDAAHVVTQTIDKLDKTITLNSEKAILDARKQYDALNAMAKTYVTNYNTLVNAERMLAELKEAEEENSENEEEDSLSLQIED